MNAYDNAGVARLFARPAAVGQGGVVYALRTYKEIALWHQSLPCAARITSITVKGKDTTAVFVLRNGKNRRCDAPGGKVAAVFRISGGKIHAWAQIPVPKPQQTDGLARTYGYPPARSGSSGVCGRRAALPPGRPGCASCGASSAGVVHTNNGMGSAAGVRSAFSAALGHSMTPKKCDDHSSHGRDVA